MTQARSTAPKPLVSVYAEKGVLAFRFSSKFNSLFEILDGKAPSKQKTMGLGLRESAENWKLAQSAALRIERDLSDSENWQLVFDPTFVKYGLAVKYSSAALKLAAPIPEPEPEMTVGTMWEDYLTWKQPQLESTTFQMRYRGTYTNAVKGLAWDKRTAKLADTQNGVWDMHLSNAVADKLSVHPVSDKNKKYLLVALTEAFTRLQSLGKTKLMVNPFVIVGGVTENKTDKYKPTVNGDGTIRAWYEIQDTETNPDERDRRAFTKDERDTIIKAFYESDKANVRQAAQLIEFLFLTGCRSGEAFALTWNNIKFDNNQIIIHKSYAATIKQVKCTKNADTRLFVIYPKLRDLLLRIKPADAKPTDLLFKQLNGKPHNSTGIGCIWREGKTKSNGKEYCYPGVVTQLVESGAISCYLSPYHTRHTFITLQARAGVDLTMLAGICSTGVDKIHQHYLEHDKTAKPLDI